MNYFTNPHNNTGQVHYNPIFRGTQNYTKTTYILRGAK